MPRTLHPMGLSSLLLVISVVVGVGAGLLVWRRSWASAFIAGAVVVLAGVAAANVLFHLDFFGVIHAAYLIATVSAPLFLCGVAVRWAGRRRRLAVMSVLAAVALVGTGLYASHVEPFRLDVDRHVIEMPRLTEPIRIVVISDIQNKSVGEWEYEVIEAVATENPDLVLMSGDLWQVEFGDWRERVDEFEALLADLLDRVPTLVMVDGDSDWPDGYDELVDRLGPRALFLHDEAMVTSVGDQRIMIAGAARRISDWPQRQQMMNLVAAAPDDVVTVLLAHRPEIVYELGSDQIADLTIAGHTHGGQFSVPFFGPPITLTTVPREVAAGGLHREAGALIYVSPGVGLERGQAPQMRFGVRPSIGVLDLVPELP